MAHWDFSSHYSSRFYSKKFIKTRLVRYPFNELFYKIPVDLNPVKDFHNLTLFCFFTTSQPKTKTITIKALAKKSNIYVLGENRIRNARVVTTNCKHLKYVIIYWRSTRYLQTSHYRRHDYKGVLQNNNIELF